MGDTQEEQPNKLSEQGLDEKLDQIAGLLFEMWLDEISHDDNMKSHDRKRAN